MKTQSRVIAISTQKQSFGQTHSRAHNQVGFISKDKNFKMGGVDPSTDSV